MNGIKFKTAVKAAFVAAAMLAAPTAVAFASAPSADAATGTSAPVAIPVPYHSGRTGALSFKGAAASVADVSSAHLRAIGAHQMSAVGKTSYRIEQACPDKTSGCYAIVTGQHGTATTVNGQAAVLSGSGTYSVTYVLHNGIGSFQYSEVLSAADWYNGSSAGQYWCNDSPHLAAFWSEVNGPQYSGYWDGYDWAWNNYANDTEHYSAFGYTYDRYTYLRIYLQPNGNWWAWAVSR